MHRIVCEAFYGPAPTEIHHAAHINGVRDDNRAENLRWATPEENESDKRNHGTVAAGSRNGKHTHPEVTPRGEAAGKSDLTEDAVRAIRLLRSKYKAPTRQLAMVASVSCTTIKAIVNRKTWSHI